MWLTLKEFRMRFLQHIGLMAATQQNERFSRGFVVPASRQRFDGLATQRKAAGEAPAPRKARDPQQES